VRRDDLRDALRRAAEITGDRDLVVLGSQSVHGAFNKAVLPEPTTASMEVDLLPLHDPEGEKFWALSARGGPHAGVELDGVDITTSALPQGWADRLVPFVTGDSPDAVIGWCLDPHDLVVAKAIAGRDKDRKFIRAAVRASLVDPAESLRRMRHLDPGCALPAPDQLETARFYLASLPSPGRLFAVAAPTLPKGRWRPTRDDFPPTPDMYGDLKTEPGKQGPSRQA